MIHDKTDMIVPSAAATFPIISKINNIIAQINSALKKITTIIISPP